MLEVNANPLVFFPSPAPNGELDVPVPFFQLPFYRVLAGPFVGGTVRWPLVVVFDKLTWFATLICHKTNHEQLNTQTTL